MADMKQMMDAKRRGTGRKRTELRSTIKPFSGAETLPGEPGAAPSAAPAAAKTVGPQEPGIVPRMAGAAASLLGKRKAKA